VEETPEDKLKGSGLYAALDANIGDFQLEATGATSSATANASLALIKRFATPSDYANVLDDAQRMDKMSDEQLRAFNATLAIDKSHAGFQRTRRSPASPGRLNAVRTQ
jgi:hypothetical protein